MAAPKKISATVVEKSGEVVREISPGRKRSTKSTIADVLTVLDQTANVDDGYRTAVLEVVRRQPKTPRSRWK
jgi:hypothetical protein